MWRAAKTGWRRLLSTPLSSLFSLLALSVVLSVVTTVLTLWYETALKPLPMEANGTPMVVEGALPQYGMSLMGSPLVFQKLQQAQLGIVSAYGETESLTPRDGGAIQVTPLRADLYSMLGVRPLLGQLPDDGAESVLVIGEALWRSRFAGTPDIVGRVLTDVPGSPRVVAVMPASFQFPDRNSSAWRPLPLNAEQLVGDAAGRLGDWTVLVQSTQAPKVLEQRIQAALGALPELEGMRSAMGLQFQVRPFRERWIGGSNAVLQRLLLALLPLLALVLVNVAATLSERLFARRGELAIHDALGATRTDQMRPLLGELIVLLGLAGLFSILPTGAIQSLLLNWSFLEQDLPIALLAPADLALVLLTVVLACWLVLAALVVPLQGGILRLARINQQSTRSGESRATRRFRRFVVAAQIAIGSALVALAAVMLQSVAALIDRDLGIEARQLLAEQIDGVRSGESVRPPSASEVEGLLARVRAMPGVAAAAYAQSAPLSGTFSGASYVLAGSAEQLKADHWGVGPDYFNTLGIPLLIGRDFTTADAEVSADAVAPVIVDQSFVDRHFSGRSPVGSRIRIAAAAEAEIIGVVASAQHHGALTESSQPQIYQPFRAGDRGVAILVRSENKAADLVAPLSGLIESLAPQVDHFTLGVLGDRVLRGLALHRHLRDALMLFAALALAVCALGIGSMTAVMVRRRAHEFGVRLALGAGAADLRRQVVIEIGRVCLVGCLAGSALAFALARLVQAQMAGIHAPTAGPLVMAALLCSLVCGLACLGAVRRAGRLDPVVCLRGGS